MLIYVKYSMDIKALRKAFKGAVTVKRSALERGTLALSWDLLRARAPQGNGRPVLVLPGFLTNDYFTGPLRDCLMQAGYKAYSWEGGFNLGINDKSAAQIRARLKQVFDENGGQKVSLVGHSLGGMFARELAREFPGMVRDVITLGTPFGGMDDRTATPGYLRELYTQINPGTAHILQDAANANRLLTPPPVPTTSIYSVSDEVVDWRACLNPETPLTENIRIPASHAGMPFNPAALFAVLDRLAQKEGAWKPFRAPRGTGRIYGQSAEQKAAAPANPGWKPPAGSKSASIFKKNP
jgi:pimeloyl-ACP methyl ester carboxylesterase